MTKKPHGLKGRPSRLKGKGRNLAWLKEHVGHASDECLIYPFSKTYQGYGQVGYFGKVRKAHRVMCELAKGPPPTPEHHAAHNCGKGHLGCVNPRHVDWKTPSENRMDQFAHGTGNPPHLRRLTIDQVEEIKASAIACVDLAKQYNVSVAAIFKIKRGETWSKPRSNLTLENIRAIKDAPEDEAIAIGKSLGLFRHRVLRLRAGALFAGIE